MLVISSTSKQADKWFKFPETVDFERCMPAEQAPSMGGQKAEGRGQNQANTIQATPEVPPPPPASAPAR